jgi:hypothetical protein
LSANAWPRNTSKAVASTSEAGDLPAETAIGPRRQAIGWHRETFFQPALDPAVAVPTSPA